MVTSGTILPRSRRNNQVVEELCTVNESEEIVSVELSALNRVKDVQELANKDIEVIIDTKLIEDVLTEQGIGAAEECRELGDVEVLE